MIIRIIIMIIRIIIMIIIIIIKEIIIIITINSNNKEVQEVPQSKIILPSERGTEWEQPQPKLIVDSPDLKL